jgi:uncharacterized protein (TIGR04255 family)
MAGVKYANPPIDEAVCQFTLAESVQWTESTPNRLFEHLKDRYPGLPSQQQMLQANLTPGGGILAPELALARNERVVFIDDRNEGRLSVGPRIVSVHRARPYIGFEEELLPRIKRDVPSVLEVLEHAPVFSGIAVRYINRIVIRENSFDLSEYFTYWGASSALPEPFDGDLNGFFYRTGGKRTSRPETLTLTFASVDAPKDSAAFVLDIDLVHNFDDPLDTASAITRLTELKTLENQIFESLITDKCRDLFQ